jgi:cell division protein FtsI/penicillin-binding protein 2
MTGGKFKKRAYMLMAFFCCWTAFITFKYLYYAYWQRDYYLIKGNKLSCREGTYSAGRGRILDCNGIPLAWSERHYDLYILDLPNSPEYRQQLVRILKKDLGDLNAPELIDAGVVIKYDLSPDHLETLRKLIPKHPCLKIKVRLVRRVIEYPEVRNFIGKVKASDKVLRGISGCEKMYDLVLRGKLGKYRIMLDRNKNWIPGTFKQFKEAIPGSDVRLAQSLEEIRRNPPPRHEG